MTDLRAMADARTVIARAIRSHMVCGAMLGGPKPDSEYVFCDDPRLSDDVRSTCDCHAGADYLLACLAAARLAVVPVPEGDVVEAAAHALFMAGFGSKMSAEAAAIVAPIIAAAEREACAKTLIALAEREGFLSAEQIEAAIRAGGRDV